MLQALLFALPAVVVSLGAADLPAPSEEAIDALTTRLGGRDPNDRLAAACALAALPAAGLDSYRRRLLRERPIPTDTFRKLLLEIWAQVPNTSPLGGLWTMKPEPPWRPARVAKGKPRPRRPTPHDPEKLDWLTALATLDVGANAVLAPLPGSAAARALALEAVALMRALAATGRPEALGPLFDFAFAHDGVFRDECGRAIRALGALSVPGLIQRMHAPGKGLARQHRYASYQLDRMDRQRPSTAIACALDDRLRADILHAYGEARALDAVESVLGQVDAASRRVRREARFAWLRYVSGPPPPPAPKRKRKLQGGSVEKEEKEDYLNYREMAMIALDQHIAGVLDKDPAASEGPLGKAALAKLSSAELTAALFAYYDGRHAAEWNALFERGAGKRATGDLAGAIGDFSTILAHDPMYERRGEMAEAFQAQGDALLAAEPERAVRLWRQAVDLDAGGPASPRARHIEAAIALRDGSLAALRRALVLEPEHAAARAALDEIEAGKRRRVRRRDAIAGGAAILIVMVIALAARRRRPTR
ncbi:MAG: hypothetical protein EXR72_20390 [Myxococcales bacterium]|nr:hypothetical protein [Myxococcales bacterium]